MKTILLTTRRLVGRCVRRKPALLFVSLHILYLSGISALQAQPLSLATAYETAPVRRAQPQVEQRLGPFLERLGEVYNIKFAYGSQLVDDKQVKISPEWLKPGGDKAQLAEILKEILTPLQLAFQEVNAHHIVIFGARSSEQPVEKINRASPGRLAAPLSAPRLAGARSQLVQRLQAYQQTISGQVTDAETQEAIPGVNVVAKGTTQGTITDMEGHYSLTLPDSVTVLVFSSLGYVAQEVAINGRAVLNLSLRTDVQALDEVIIVGASLKEEDLTGAVARVTEKTLEERPVTSLNDALQGRVAGVNIQTNPEPGGNAGIKIRGTNSMQFGGSPIYVVDGVIMERDFNMINLNDIASVNVLKDASSTALYGSRGANGVVVITTKKGRKGEGKITYDGWFGGQSFANASLTLGASDMYELRVDALENATSIGGAYYAAHPGATRQDFINDELLGEGKRWFADYELDSYRNGQSYNWLDAVTRTAYQQNHTLGFSGGSENSAYYLSLGYTDQQGLVKNSGYKRYTGRINADQSIKPWLKIGTNTSFARSEEDLVDGSVFRVASGANPLLPIQSDSLYLAWGNNWDINMENPLRSLRIARDRTKNRIFSNNYLNINPIDGLNFRTSLSTDYIEQEYYEYVPSDLQQALRDSYRGRGIHNLDHVFNFQWDNSLTYEKYFERHTLSALVATSMSRNKFTYTNVTARDFPTDDFGYYNLGAAFDKENFALGSGYSASTLMSYLVRANYDYDSRYYLTMTARYDGSSKFAPGYKWGLFPSLSLAWNLTNEAFLQGQQRLDLLKLRFGYGSVGNQNIPDYTFYSLYNPSYSDGNVSYNSTGMRGTPNLTWEKQVQANVGIDLGFLNNRVQLTADYFNIVNSNLLMRRSLSTLTGYREAIVNIGEMTNRGVEVSLTGLILNQTDVKWSVSANLSADKNKITKLYGDVDAVYSFGGFTGTDIQREGNFFLGQSLNTIYMWEFDRIIQASDMDYVNSLVLPGKTLHPGDILPKDQQAEGEEGHGIIDQDDRVIIGKKDPKFYGGFSTEFSWKGLALNAIFTYSYGAKAVSGYYEGLMSGTGYGAAHRDMLDRWTPTHTDTRIPRATYDNASRFSSGETSWGIQDASYLRLSTLTLSYTLPNALAGRASFSNVRFYVTGTNTLLWTSYKGYDPANGDWYPTAKQLVLGLNFSL
ncbi:TonB-linked outer membrane protein, SusC/RagA family [Catalinimonas alkaloidigena]|uniref:TonB-linked outer membrane protein, SusC/RagA family n=1 Tax=Catalinimonas alkaloidigena TaxID=1075417 RepID=A0A1G8XEN9_9BACT|nr:TonB-dependent receptor [Catalinimonas alkaloidigena]SDJ88886.1 TonB-linked outer membrane protein, SusC/RagA family [Catalinimonas alkaloidigena]